MCHDYNTHRILISFPLNSRLWGCCSVKLGAKCVERNLPKFKLPWILAQRTEKGTGICLPVPGRWEVNHQEWLRSVLPLFRNVLIYFSSRRWPRKTFLKYCRSLISGAGPPPLQDIPNFQTIPQHLSITVSSVWAVETEHRAGHFWFDVSVCRLDGFSSGVNDSLQKENSNFSMDFSHWNSGTQKED